MSLASGELRKAAQEIVLDDSHFKVRDFIKSNGPVPACKIAKALGLSRQALCCRVDTLTFVDGELAEDEDGNLLYVGGYK